MNSKFGLSTQGIIVSGIVLALSSCANINTHNNDAIQKNQGLSGEIILDPENLAAPEQWRNSLNKLKSAGSWLNNFHDPLLIKTVEIALANNYQLKQQALAVDIKKRQLLNADASFWPDISTNLSTARSKNSNISTSASLSLKVKYEVDLWGKLSASEQKANLDWLSQQANFEQAQLQLVVTTITAWYNAVAAEKLLSLNVQRSNNTQQNLDIIESGYKQGLNSSLDVYLTRNELNSALARVAELKQNVLEAKHRLEILMGKYPAADILLSAQLLEIDTALSLDAPISILQRKPSLRASWYQLLASDAALAFAHKQRFPSFSLSASLSDNQSKLSNLLSGSSLAWSLLGNISAPLFQAGRLRNNEEIARLTLRQQEQNYLDKVYQAFSDVENAISAETSLQQRALLQQRAGENAQTAYQLSFEQYQQGLVNYSTVLDAQNRWFDAQSSVIQIQNKLITNRVNLNLALGGSYLNPLSSKPAVVAIK
ncbi:MAG: RND transporter [Gammaproteobacteria bacterium]|nr:MAG: RND transporter [Gammaproteobacteria bacterium]